MEAGVSELFFYYESKFFFFCCRGGGGGGRQMNRPKPICPFNFFEVGGITVH